MITAVATRLVLDTVATWTGDVMIGTVFITRLAPPRFSGSPTPHFFVCLDRLECEMSLLHVGQFADGAKPDGRSAVATRLVLDTAATWAGDVMIGTVFITRLAPPYSDFKPLVKRFIRSKWSDFWVTQINNKLHSVQPTLGCGSLSNRDRRREQLVLCRLRLGHTYITHRYLLAGEEASPRWLSGLMRSRVHSV